MAVMRAVRPTLPGLAEQLAAARISHLRGDVERAEDMPTSCEGCGNCCGRVLITDAEDNRRVERFATRRRINPTKNNVGGHSGQEQMCGWLDTDARRCRIYPARPKVCRCWGSPHDGELLDTKPGQPCGLRADMLDVWGRHGALGYYDTWTSEWMEIAWEEG